MEKKEGTRVRLTRPGPDPKTPKPPNTPVWAPVKSPSGAIAYPLSLRPRRPSASPTPSFSSPAQHVRFRRPDRRRGPSPLVRPRTRPPVVRPPCLCLGRAASQLTIPPSLSPPPFHPVSLPISQTASSSTPSCSPSLDSPETGSTRSSSTSDPSRKACAPPSSLPSATRL